MKRITSKILGVRELANKVYHYDFSFEDDPIEFEAGQFFLIEVDDGKEPKVTRAYSLCSAPRKDQFSMCIKLLPEGRASDYLRGLDIGSEIAFKGPFGHFTLKDSEKDVVMIATGTGVAPFVGMLPVLFERGFKGKITLIFGNRSEDEILYKEELEEMAAEHDNFELVMTCSQPSEEWDGNEGRVQKYIKEGNFDMQNSKFYVCGNGDMVMDVRSLLLDEMGLQKEDLHFEQFSPPKKK